MIGVRTTLAWVVCVDAEDHADLPPCEEIERHIQRVEQNRCDHYAVTVNGRVQLETCPNCASNS